MLSASPLTPPPSWKMGWAARLCSALLRRAKQIWHLSVCLSSFALSYTYWSSALVAAGRQAAPAVCLGGGRRGSAPSFAGRRWQCAEQVRRLVPVRIPRPRRLACPLLAGPAVLPCDFLH